MNRSNLWYFSRGMLLMWAVFNIVWSCSHLAIHRMNRVDALEESMKTTDALEESMKTTDALIKALNEQTRQMNEQTRQLNEQTRQLNERSARVEAENRIMEEALKQGK